MEARLEVRSRKKPYHSSRATQPQSERASPATDHFSLATQPLSIDIRAENGGGAPSFLTISIRSRTPCLPTFTASGAESHTNNSVARRVVPSLVRAIGVHSTDGEQPVVRPVTVMWSWQLSPEQRRVLHSLSESRFKHASNCALCLQGDHPLPLLGLRFDAHDR